MLHRNFLIATGTLLLLLCIAYSNHFDNGFYFDDTHTIVNNQYIRDISNIPLFFKDVVTDSTMPNNRGYRPVVTTLNAIDYWFSDSLDPFYFHRSIFFWYLVQLVLMFFFFRKIFSLTMEHEWNNYFALGTTFFYGLHAANAETINYIIMRSDSFSTLCIVAAFVLYQIQLSRKWFLYLIPVVIGLGAKETTMVFPMLLFFYVLLFEEKVSLIELIQFKKLKNIVKAMIKAAPPVIMAIIIFVFIKQHFFPGAMSDLVEVGEPDWRFNYFITQWYVIAHYIGNFVLPLDLSADPDLKIIPNILDRRVLLSLGLILILVVIGFITSIKKEHRPIAFGLIWFIFALGPTSSFIPFGQISNDHRTFFPYLGLALSVGCFARLLITKYKTLIQDKPMILRGGLASIMMIFLLHAYGTHERNKVWSTQESLWLDASTKSPNNGRALMNYGLSQMALGKYDVALEYFKKTEKLLPYWAYIHINMGILKGATGHLVEAEAYFRNAIRHQPSVAESYYYYARWLKDQKRVEDAIVQLKVGQEKSPGHANINNLLNALNQLVTTDPLEQLKNMEQTVEDNPSPENLLNLSLMYYRNGQFEDCITACRQAIEKKPDFALAYNNICSAYNALGQWENALEACKKAVEIEPDYQLAKNNLKMVQDNLAQ